MRDLKKFIIEIMGCSRDFFFDKVEIFQTCHLQVCHASQCSKRWKNDEKKIELTFVQLLKFHSCLYVF